jgi:hypothetical protein
MTGEDGEHFHCRASSIVRVFRLETGITCPETHMCIAGHSIPVQTGREAALARCASWLSKTCETNNVGAWLIIPHTSEQRHACTQIPFLYQLLGHLSVSSNFLT